MSHEHHPRVGTVVLAAFSGVLVALQSRANGGLSHSIGNGPEAALISFGSGLVVLMVMAAVSPKLREGLRGIRAALASRVLPRWQTLAGTGGAMFVMVQAFGVPRVGVAVFSVATIAGQSFASVVVDRLGIRAGVRHRMSLRRLLAAGIATAAVFVSVADRMNAGFGWLAVIAVAAGAIVAVQRALNAHINDYSKHSYATTLLNFATGTLLLIVVNAFAWRDLSAAPTSTSSWWMYAGGTIGVIYIALFAIVVQRIGVLMSTVLSVGGQLVGSLGIDLATGVHLAGTVYAGVVLSFAGILVGVARRRVTT